MGIGTRRRVEQLRIQHHLYRRLYSSVFNPFVRKWDNIMAFQPAPNIGQFALRFGQANQKIENVFHCRRDAGWDSGALNEVAGVFVEWWRTSVRPFTVQSCILESCAAKDLSTLVGAAAEYTTSLPVAGGNDTQAAPLNVTCAVHWGTGTGGRSGHGRTYHIGLCNTQCGSDSRLTNAAVAEIKDAYETLRVGLDNALLGVEFGILSRYTAGAPRPNGILYPITGVSLEQTLDSQRRRLPGRGR